MSKKKGKGAAQSGQGPWWTNGPVTLYHGTCQESAQDIIDHGVNMARAVPRSQAFTDFGPGFYTTEDRMQADEWASKHFKGRAAIVKIVVQREELAKLACLAFESDTVSFWNLIRHHRMEGKPDHCRLLGNKMYDMVVGPVADSWGAKIGVCDVCGRYGQVSFHTERAEAMLLKADRDWERLK